MKYFICKNTKVFLVKKGEDTPKEIANIIKTEPKKITEELRLKPSDIFLDPGVNYPSNDYRHTLSENGYIGFNVAKSSEYSKIVIFILDTYPLAK